MRFLEKVMSKNLFYILIQQTIIKSSNERWKFQHLYPTLKFNRYLYLEIQ